MSFFEGMMESVIGACAGPRSAVAAYSSRAKHAVHHSPFGTMLGTQDDTDCKRRSVMTPCMEDHGEDFHMHEGLEEEQQFWTSGGTHESYHFVAGVLSKHFLFANLPPEAIKRVVMFTTRREFGPRTPVYIQGDEGGDTFYIVESGKLNVTLNAQKVDEKKPGDTFGHRALSYDHTRATSVTTGDDTTVLYCLKRHDFQRAMALAHANPSLLSDNDIQALGRCPLFAGMSEASIHGSVAPFFSLVQFSQEENIFQQDQPGDNMYIIKSGRVNLVQTPPNTGRSHILTRPALKPGDYFGEGALWGAARNCSAVPTGGAVVCWAMQHVPVDTMPPWLRDLMPKLQKDFNSRSLLLIPLFQSLLPDTVKQLANAMKEVNVKAGQVVFKRQDVADSFYVVKSGTVRCTTPNATHPDQEVLLSIYNAGDYFGMMELLEAVPLRATTVTAQTDAVLLLLSQDEFVRLLGPLKDVLVQEVQKRKELFVSIAEKPLPTDFDFKYIIGRGKFSVVWMASLKRAKKPFAVKIVEKADIIEHKFMKQIQQEFRTLCSLEFPFIVSGIWTLQDANRIYLVSDLCVGGDLKTLLKHMGGGQPTELQQDQAKFYVVQVILALQHLHENGIIYRDLKPENVLLDSQGCGQLANFELSRDVSPGETVRTVCGLPEYMSPEMIGGRGYSFSHDFWSLGVFVYELLVGTTPFNKPVKSGDAKATKDAKSSHHDAGGGGGAGGEGKVGDDGKVHDAASAKIQERIMKGVFQIPAHVRSANPEACDFVDKLLEVDTKKRLGHEGQWEAVWKHRWLSGENTKIYLSRRIPAPFTTQSVPRNLGTTKTEPKKFEGNQLQFDWIESVWT